MSEEVKKSFTRKVMEGLFWSSSGSGILKIVGLVITFLVIAKLSLHEYGTYQLVLAAWGLLLIFFFQGINQVVIARAARSVKDGNEIEAVDMGRGLFLFKMAVGIPLWAIVFFGADFLKTFYSGDIIEFLRVLSWSFLAIPLSECIRFDLTIRLRFFSLNLFNIIEELIRGLGVLAALFWLQSGIEGLLWALVLSITITPILFLPFIKHSYFKKANTFRLKPFLDLVFNQGGWIIGQKFIRQAEKNIRPFFIQYFVGREGVALFAVAEKLLSHLMTLIPTNEVLLPSVSAEASDEGRMHRVLERGIKYTVPLYFVLSVIAFFAARPFLALLFPQYVASLPLFNILLIYAPFTGVASILTSFYFSKQEQRMSFFIMLTRLMGFLVLAPILLTSFGLMGIAVEFVISLYLYNGIRYVSLARMYPYLRISLNRLIRFDEYDKLFFDKIVNRLTPAKK